MVAADEENVHDNPAAEPLPEPAAVAEETPMETPHPDGDSPPMETPPPDGDSAPMGPPPMGPPPMGTSSRVSRSDCEARSPCRCHRGPFEREPCAGLLVLALGVALAHDC